MKRKDVNSVVLMEQGLDLIDFYRNNPSIAASDLLGVDFAPIQQVVFNDMWFKNYNIAVMGRGGGKTFMLGVLATLSCMLYPGYRVGLIGPVFRQSKMIFAEVEKLYSRSEILRECVEKKPTRGSDTCYLRFKSVGGVSGSYIEALPLGVDGSKIRGSRFYLICIDELAQVPDKIIDMVIRPFAATTLEPMENVRKVEQQRRMIEMGLATEDDFEAVVNKMVMTSSGFYKFNHMWKRMKDHWLMMEEQGDKSQYSVHQVPYWDLPEGFLDLNNIEESRRIMSDHEFRMEYEADMISDSEGFFKASLLEACTIGSGVKVEHKGEKGSSYIIGVDPNQGGSASCGIIIVKVGPTNHIVNVLELKGHTTQEMTEVVINVCSDFNIIRIFMDQGGGGKAIMDLLDDGYGGNTPIIDVTDDDKKYKKGRHILYMVNFNPSWIADANFTSLALFEEGRLKFPEPPEHKFELKGAGKFNDLQAAVFERIQKLKSQMLNIVVTQTASGLLHFDTPKKGQNKDLYSALILAAHGARLVEKELEGEVDPILHNESGLVRPAKSSGDGHWDTIDKRGPTVKSQKGLHLAVLEKRR